MTTLSPTSLAVSAAVADHREAAGLTVDELAETVRHLGYRMTPADIRAIEAGEVPATVDDLVALAVALGTTPVVLLSHVPADLPDPDEGPIATGVPDDVAGSQLRDWMEGRTALDRQSRVAYWRERASRLELRRIHHQEQQEAAATELADLGELALQEADAGPVIALHERVDEGDWLLGQCDRAQALIEHRLDRLTRIK
jgi:transcriptional regulator with XRE-family HTH domain